MIPHSNDGANANIEQDSTESVPHVLESKEAINIGVISKKSFIYFEHNYIASLFGDPVPDWIHFIFRLIRYSLKKVKSATIRIQSGIQFTFKSPHALMASSTMSSTSSSHDDLLGVGETISEDEVEESRTLEQGVLVVHVCNEVNCCCCCICCCCC